MTLSATKEAIGAVSEAVRSQLAVRTGLLVTVSRPDAAALAHDMPRLNLFLYQIEFDAHLKNHSLDEGQPAPLWLVLRYLLTAYDESHDSDSTAAHGLLGHGLSSLQEMVFLAPAVPALLDNPEPLKLTFDPCEVELLSKIMQGSDEKYRISAGFQVRPVLIAPDILPAYAPPVLTVGPPSAPGVAVLPASGPRLYQVLPARFEAGATLELAGDGIGARIDSVHLGPLALPPSAAREGAVRVRVPASPAISAGDHPIKAALRLPSGRLQFSNPLIVTLLPSVTAATHGVLSPSGTALFGNVGLTGERLGAPDDAIFLAFYRDGAVALNLELAGTVAQTSLSASVGAAHALPAGTYYLILRVNGAQAVFAPPLEWTP